MTESQTINYQIHQIPMDELMADSDFNCRGEISALDVVDLAKSIDKDGLLQPIIVRPLKKDERQKAVDEGHNYMFCIIAGYCRHMAHIVLKRDVIPCIVRDDLDEKTARILNLTENLGRQNLNILQEARGILPLMALGMNEYKIAEAIPNISRGWVQVRKMLLRLPYDVQQEAAAGTIGQADIRNLVTLKINGGTDDDLFAACRQIKDAKRTKTKQPNIKRKMPPEKAIRIRKRPELFSMIDHILNSVNVDLKVISPQFGTRCLSWAAGHISDLDLFCDIREICELQNIPYTLPKESI